MFQTSNVYGPSQIGDRGVGLQNLLPYWRDQRLRRNRRCMGEDPRAAARPPAKRPIERGLHISTGAIALMQIGCKAHDNQPRARCPSAVHADPATQHLVRLPIPVREAPIYDDGGRRSERIAIIEVATTGKRGAQRGEIAAADCRLSDLALLRVRSIRLPPRMDNLEARSAGISPVARPAAALITVRYPTARPSIE